jgi:hypothetical protein
MVRAASSAVKELVADCWRRRNGRRVRALRDRICWKGYTAALGACGAGFFNLHWADDRAFRRSGSAIATGSIHMRHSMVPRLLSMFGVWLLLVIWNLSAGYIGDLGNLLFLFIIAVPVAMSGVEGACYRRHAFRKACLLPPSWLYRLMGLEPLIVGAEVVKALLLGLLLMVGTVSLTVREWCVLCLDVFVLALLMPRVPGLLHENVNPTYLYAMSRHWAIWFSTALLWLDFLLALGFGVNNDYRGLSWAEAVAYSTSVAPGVDDGGIVDLMLRIDAGLNGLASWASYELLYGANDLAQGLAAAMVLIGVVIAGFALAWAYSRALVGAMARPFEVWRSRSSRRDGGDAYEPWWV